MNIVELRHMNPAVAAVAMGASFAAAFVLDEKTAVPIGSACAICGLIFWIGRKWQKLADKIEDLDIKVSNLPCVRPECPNDDKKRYK